MAKDLVERNTMTAIGNAIRSKLNNSTRYKPFEMPGAITSIPEGYPEPAGTVSITQNGTQNVKDYASASVAVPNSYAAGDEGKVVSNGALVAQTARAAEITQNGTYDTTLNDEVTVNVAGGGGAKKEFLYEFNESQGSVWINTQVNMENIDTLLFEDVRSGDLVKSAMIAVANIAVYTGGADVFTSIYTQTKPMNVRIYNGYLYVSYNGIGASTNVTKVYKYSESSGGGTTILSGTTEPTAAQGSDGDIYLQYNDAAVTTICAAYLKVNGAWQALIGSDISDVITQ